MIRIEVLDVCLNFRVYKSNCTDNLYRRPALLLRMV